MTLFPYNQVTLNNAVAVQLVSSTAGPHTYTLINLGPGNLYVRQDQAPSSPTDARAMKIPAAITAPFQIYVYNGATGIWVMADQTGAISVADTGVR